MAYFSRRVVEEVPTFETEVWACASKDCRGWMRKDFSFAEQPEKAFLRIEFRPDSQERLLLLFSDFFIANEVRPS